MMISPFTTRGGDVPIGAITAYAGVLSTPVSSPPDSQQSYVDAQVKTGITNNIEGFGWMVCDGRELYCYAYPELFQAIGFLYSLEGEPTEVTANLPEDQKFRIPDFRGYFLRGATGNTTNDPDLDQRKLANKQAPTSDNKQAVGSFQEDALQIHEHQYDGASMKVTVSAGSTAVAVATETPSLTGEPTDQINATPPNGKVRISSETRPKNAYVNYLIKYAYV